MPTGARRVSSFSATTSSPARGAIPSAICRLPDRPREFHFCFKALNPRLRGNLPRSFFAVVEEALQPGAGALISPCDSLGRGDRGVKHKTAKSRDQRTARDPARSTTRKAAETEANELEPKAPKPRSGSAAARLAAEVERLSA